IRLRPKPATLRVTRGHWSSQRYEVLAPPGRWSLRLVKHKAPLGHRPSESYDVRPIGRLGRDAGELRQEFLRCFRHRSARCENPRLRRERIAAGIPEPLTW